MNKKKKNSLAGIEPTISGLEGHALPVEPRAQSLMIIVGLKMDCFPNRTKVVFLCT